MADLLGTVVASPIVPGSSSVDKYGTHYSFLGVGGYQEFGTIAERNAIPLDILGRLGNDGLSSGRRRLGMLVYVGETNTLYQLNVPFASWTGLTTINKVSTLGNNSNWVPFAAGGGDAIKKRYTQALHGFVLGDIIAYNGTTFVKKLASAGNTDETIGLVSRVDDVNNFTVTYAGFVDTTGFNAYSTVSANTVYFASPSVPGLLTPIAPANIGEEIRPILVTQTLTTGVVLQYRGNIITEVNTTGSSQTTSGLRIERVVTQASHGFALGDVLKYSGNTYQKASANKLLAHFHLGVVNKVLDVNRFTICFGGYIDNMQTAFDASGAKHFSGGTTYYLSPTVLGKLTPTKPTGLNDLVTPIYQPISNSDGIVVNQIGKSAVLPISGVSGLTTVLNSKINTSTIGSPNGIAPLGSNSIIPIQYIPAGLKEEYVVPNMATRNTKFYMSGGTGTTGQTMSFRGLKVFVLNASGATGFPIGYSGSSEFIDTTGFLKWSAITGTVYINWTDIKQKPNLVNRITGGTATTTIHNGTGNTSVNILYDNKYIGLSGNSLSVKQSSLDVSRFKFQGTSGTTGQFIVRGSGSTIQAVTLPNALIGPAEDGFYTDGLFTDFVNTTPVGTAIDRFNEVLKALAPQPAPNLNQTTGTSGTFVIGKLSFGASKSLTGFTNVGTNASNPSVDINGTYGISGTRLGITSSALTGVLNNNTVGGVGNIPYANTSFNDGDKGKLILYKNGIILSQLILSGTTAATSNVYLSVSSVSYVKFPNGQPLTSLTYRTGMFNMPVSAMTKGYNYIRIIHTGTTFSRQTNFLEWVYDNDASNIALTSTTGLTNPTFGGSKFISGVKYYTGGTIQYQATVTNVYKNIYSTSTTAIDFFGKDNLGAMSNLDVTGAGIINRTSSLLQTLPILNSGATNPQNTNISVLATFNINPSVLLGNVGLIGRLRSSFSLTHPFTSQGFSGGQSTLTGLMIYPTIQVSTGNNETFDGEVDRLEARNYASLTYSNVNSGTYTWTSSQNIVSGNAQHNTGLLVFNGELMYPNATYLTSQYGITTGNFGGVTYSPAGNPNYTSASLSRDYYRKFKSATGTTQSTLTFNITHTGTNTDFLTNGSTGGTVSSNNLKFEFLIMRSGGAIHGWSNPFASSGNPDGIANTASSHSAGVTTVSCTLSTIPRVALNDIVIVRIITSSSYSNRIQNLAITNI
jgi:hypothetical protein